MHSNVNFLIWSDSLRDMCSCSSNIFLLFQIPDDLSLSHFSGGHPPIVLTSDIQRNASMIMPWLHHETRQPFLLVGPEGCGKE